MVNRFDVCFAAKAATGAGENVAGKLVEVDLDGGSYEDVQDVAERRIFAGEARRDFGNVGAVSKQTF